MGTVSISAITTPAASTTGTLQRDVADTIRHLWPGNTMMALVSSGLVKGKEIVTKPGLIGKRQVKTPLFECFTYTPIGITVTVISATDADTYVLSDSTPLTLKQCLYNPSNGTMCRIDVNTTGTNTIDITSVGSTTFSAVATDILLCLAPAYAENSTSPYIISKTDDQVKNYTQIVRFPVEISGSAKDNPHFGGDYWKRIKGRSVIEGIRRTELSCLFSQPPASGESTTSANGLTDAFRTMKGYYNFAAYTKPVGTMTVDRWVSELPTWMSDTIGADTPCVMFCGKKIYGQMLTWVTSKLMVQNDGTHEKFGVKSKVFSTGGPDIEVMVMDAFDRGAMTNKALIFPPEDCNYIFKQGRDLRANNNIQPNDQDGFKDEITGEISVESISGGEQILTLTDWN